MATKVKNSFFLKAQCVVFLILGILLFEIGLVHVPALAAGSRPGSWTSIPWTDIQQGMIRDKISPILLNYLVTEESWIPFQIILWRPFESVINRLLHDTGESRTQQKRKWHHPYNKEFKLQAATTLEILQLAHQLRKIARVRELLQDPEKILHMSQESLERHLIDLRIPISMPAIEHRKLVLIPNYLKELLTLTFSLVPEFNKDQRGFLWIAVQEDRQFAFVNQMDFVARYFCALQADTYGLKRLNQLRDVLRTLYVREWTFLRPYVNHLILDRS